MPHHPRLRQCECQKSAHRKQRNQPVGHPSKQNQQQPRKNRQRPDSLREHQPPSARRQRMRKIIIPSNHPAQPRKIRKRSIRRKTQDQQNRKHSQIVKNPLARDRSRKHRQHALIPWSSRIRSHNPVVPHQQSNSSQKHNQNRDDRCQRSPSRRNHRFPERLHSVTNRLDARQSRASRSKRPKQQPQSHRLQSRRSLLRRRHHRDWMPPRRHHLVKPNHNHHRQSSHKQIGRSNKCRPRFLHSPKIDHRQNNQHRQTHRQSVWQQRRHCRYQRPNPRRDSHRHIQQVIDHQSRARQQSRPVPQVLLGNRVRSPAIRISRNRLPVTEIHNHQQPNDRSSQRHNVPDSHQPQRQQNRQSRLRSVGRRTQGIQSKRRNPLSRRNPLPFILRGSQRPPKQNINQSHVPSHPSENNTCHIN